MITLLQGVLRRILASRGYVLSYFEAGTPARLEPYLARSRREGSFDRIWSVDSDPETLNLFSQAFAGREIQFESDSAALNPPAAIGHERTLLQLEIGQLQGELHSSLLAHLERAAVVVVRSKIGPFWSGTADLSDLTDLMARHGLQIQDILQEAAGPPIAIPGGNVFLAFERPVSPPEPDRQPQFRISEASTLLSSPIAPQSSLVRLTGRGSHGFAAGVFNPGAWHDGQHLRLLARAEQTAWPAQKRSRTRYLSSCRPLLLTLDAELRISAASPVSIVPAPSDSGLRAEDFRVFGHQGVVYSNHVEINAQEEIKEGIPLRPERLTTRVRISRLDPGEIRLILLEPVKLDRPTAEVEKNWAMFSQHEQVHLIYSFNPYRRFAASRFPESTFALAAEQPLQLPWPDDGLKFRNSINPVSWDEQHLLHIVHKVFPEKRYVFWAVLLDRQSLLPVKITQRPLVTDRSSGTSITYVCSALCQGKDLVLFGGLDDCSIGAWRLPKACLDLHWTPIR